jgi:hypothetical protein
VTALRAWFRDPRPGWWLLLAGAAGAAMTLLCLLGRPPGTLLLPPPSRVLLAFSAPAVALMVWLAPRGDRLERLCAGLVGLGSQAVLASVPDLLAVAVLLVPVGFAVAARPGRRSLSARVRGPALAAALLGLGWALLRSPGPAWLGRLGALGVALGLVAVGGLVPYLQEVEDGEPAETSYLAWTGFLAPALALVLPFRLLQGHLLTPDEGMVVGAVLVGLGALNLAWGAVGAWRTASLAEAWRDSFLVDWGFALIGLGLFERDGLAAAYLAMLAVLGVRTPLALLARTAPAAGTGPRPLALVLVVLLAGAAPFSGFPVRLLVLRAATELAWPLAIPLLMAMALAAAHALRLARALGSPRGRGAIGLAVVLAVSLVLGLVPGILRGLGGI